MSDEKEGLEAEARELFARHGLASYRAQLLEQRLASLLATAFGDKPPWIPWDEFQRILASYSDLTFGQLLGHLRRHPAATAELIQELELRVNDRNYLVHRFFWTHAEDIVVKERRDFLVEELFKMAGRFWVANQRLRRIYFNWLQCEGVTANQIESVLREMRARRGLPPEAMMQNVAPVLVPVFPPLPSLPADLAPDAARLDAAIEENIRDSMRRFIEGLRKPTDSGS